MLDLSGVEGGGTFPEKSAEQERPYLAAQSGKDRAYKTGRWKARGAGRESEGFVVPKKACSNPTPYSTVAARSQKTPISCI